MYSPVVEPLLVFMCHHIVISLKVQKFEQGRALNDTIFFSLLDFICYWPMTASRCRLKMFLAPNLLFSVEKPFCTAALASWTSIWLFPSHGIISGTIVLQSLTCLKSIVIQLKCLTILI